MVNSYASSCRLPSESPSNDRCNDKTTSDFQYSGAFKPLRRGDVAAILGVSDRTLDNWQKSGKMPKSKGIEGCVYWHPEVFYSWLNQALQPSPGSDSAQVSCSGDSSPGRAEKSAQAPATRSQSTARVIAKNKERLAKMAAGGG
jgi:hypothetical protein